jgi:hypothetical protein
MPKQPSSLSDNYEAKLNFLFVNLLYMWPFADAYPGEQGTRALIMYQSFGESFEK